MTSPTRIALRRLRTRAQHAIGEQRRRLVGAPAGPRAVLLVLGCQRSGTTLVTDLFAADPAVKVYPEHSELSASDPRGLRLEPLPAVAGRLRRSRFPIVVLKPLVESQNAEALLVGLPNARVLWMFRHYADVARSNLVRFGEQNGIKNLRSIAQGGDDWRAERVSPEVQRVVSAHFHEAMNPWDAAALFWWARNALFFEQRLDSRADVRTCRYEDLVSDPAHVLREIYAFTGGACPSEPAVGGVSAASIALGRELPFSREVTERCEQLLARLEATHSGTSRCA